MLSEGPDVSRLRPPLLGKLMYYGLPLRRGTILRNLEHVFGAVLSREQIRTIAQCFYGHILESIYECVTTRASAERKIASMVRVEGHEHVLKAAERKKGVLILTGHFGNFELAPIAAMYHFKQYQGRFYFVRTALLSEALESLLFMRYRRAGLGVIRKQDALGHVMDVLGTNGAVVFVMDQRAGSRKAGGLKVDFFGKETSTYRSLALVAGYTGAPVVPGTSWREPDGSHVLKFLPALDWITCADAEEELRRNTLEYNRALEKLVVAHPEQWFWIHRRWKFKD